MGLMRGARQKNEPVMQMDTANTFQRALYKRSYRRNTLVELDAKIAVSASRPSRLRAAVRAEEFASEKRKNGIPGVSIMVGRKYEANSYAECASSSKHIFTPFCSARDYVTSELNRDPCITTSSGRIAYASVAESGKNLGK